MHGKYEELIRNHHQSNISLSSDKYILSSTFTVDQIKILHLMFSVLLIICCVSKWRVENSDIIETFAAELE